MRRLRSIPAPLAVLLVLAGALTLAWGIALPDLQGPDETGHVAYVQRIVDAGEIPFDFGRAGGGRGVDTASTELRAAAIAANLEPLRANPAARPAWTAADEALWLRSERRLDDGARTDGGFNSTFRNPPLYYLYAASFYLAASSGSIFDRMTAVRFANVPLALALTVLVWLLAGELLGPALGPRTLATALATLNPGVTNLEGTVNPDLMLLVWWTAGLLLMVRLVRRPPTRAGAAGLGAVLVAAGLTNGRGLLMAIPAGVAALLAWRRYGRPAGRVWAAATATALVAGLAVVLALLLRGVSTPFVHPSISGFASYVWQFYLPRLPGMGAVPGPAGYGAREAFVARVWGGFAQLEVELPSWAVDALAAAVLAVLVAGAVALWRRRSRVDGAVLAVCAAAVAGTLGGLHVIAYRSLLSNVRDPVITGRYVLVLVGLAAAGTAWVLWNLPRRWVTPLAGGVLGLAVVLQANAIGLLIERFWA